ncbi:MAG: mechanosensitive ion channel, partial [Francisellaceae bacterium]|nr:mechanosensitive ion channel [Francisellaceae bacterium]
TVSIENPQRMLNRQIKMVFGLRYQDADKVGMVTEKIEKMLKSHPDLDMKRTTFVVFNNFNHSSLDCLVYCFTKTTLWVPYLKIQQEVFVKIAEIVTECGADMAFPTTTVDLPSDVDVPEWVQKRVK